MTENREPEDLSNRLPIVIGIAGASGSGKSTLAAELAREFKGTHFPLDHYYRDLSHLSERDRAKQNFDDPAVIESSLLVQHVALLAQGNAIERPLYDFAHHTRIRGETETVQAGSALVVEGLFALHYTGLLPFYDLKVYVDTADDVCFERRLKRDVEQRGRSAQSVLHQYEATVRPAYLQYVQPSSGDADLVIDGAEALDWKVEQVFAALRHRGRLPAGRRRA